MTTRHLGDSMTSKRINMTKGVGGKNNVTNTRKVGASTYSNLNFYDLFYDLKIFKFIQMK